MTFVATFVGIPKGKRLRWLGLSKMTTGDNYLIVDGEDMLVKTKTLYEWYSGEIHCAQSDKLIKHLRKSFSDKFCFIQISA